MGMISSMCSAAFRWSMVSLIRSIARAIRGLAGSIFDAMVSSWDVRANFFISLLIAGAYCLLRIFSSLAFSGDFFLISRSILN